MCLSYLSEVGAIGCAVFKELPSCVVDFVLNKCQRKCYCYNFVVMAAGGAGQTRETHW